MTNYVYFLDKFDSANRIDRELPTKVVRYSPSNSLWTFFYLIFSNVHIHHQLIIIALHHHIIWTLNNHYPMTKVCRQYQENRTYCFYLDKFGPSYRLDGELPTKVVRYSPSNSLWTFFYLIFSNVQLPHQLIIIALHHHVIWALNNHYPMTKVCRQYQKNRIQYFYLDKFGPSYRLDGELPTKVVRYSPSNSL